MIRIFLGLKIPPQIKSHIKTIYGGIPDAHWIDPEMLHVTIKFIGEVDEITFEDIAELLDDIKVQPFKIKLQGLGFFKTGKSIRTLWLAPTGELEPLLTLKQKIDLQMRDQLSWDMDDRKYTPHVTIARLNGSSDHRVGTFIEWHNLFESQSWLVSSYTLFRSDSSKAGQIYTPLEDYDLE